MTSHTSTRLSTFFICCKALTIFFLTLTSCTSTHHLFIFFGKSFIFSDGLYIFTTHTTTFFITAQPTFKAKTVRLITLRFRTFAWSYFFTLIFFFSILFFNFLFSLFTIVGRRILLFCHLYIELFLICAWDVWICSIDIKTKVQFCIIFWIKTKLAHCGSWQTLKMW